MPCLKVLKFYPDFGPVADFDLQGIQATWGGAFGVKDLAGKCEAAVVARAEVIFSVLAIVDKATGVRANDVERLDGVFAAAPQVNGTDRRVRQFVPGIHTTGQNGKFLGRSVPGQRIKRRDEYFLAGRSLPAQWIEQHGKARASGNEDNACANPGSADLF